jgi:hypothetical protein
MVSSNGEESQSGHNFQELPLWLKIPITIFALFLMYLHGLCPRWVDYITITLLLIAIFPWIFHYFGEFSFFGNTFKSGEKFQRVSLSRKSRYESFRPAEPQIQRDVTERDVTEYLPPKFEVTQKLPNGKKRKFPDVGFNIGNPNNSPMRVKVLVKSFLGKIMLDPIPDHYSGKRIWNLNPLSGVMGHFQVSDKSIKSIKNLRLEINVIYIDQNNKEHKMLPVGFVYMRKENDWFFDP